MRILCALLFVCSLAFGQATDANLLVAKDSSYSTLAVGALIGDATITVQTGTGSRFAVNGMIIVESEKMLVTGISGDVLTVTRAYASTSAAAHAIGRNVTGMIFQEHHNRVKDELKGIHQTGAGAPSNPCALAGYRYTDTTNSKDYFCPANGGNWSEQGTGSGGGGGAGSLQSVITDFKPTYNNGTRTFTIGAGQGWTAAIPQVTFTWSSTTGTGNYIIYVTDSNTVNFELSSNIGGTPYSCLPSLVCQEMHGLVDPPWPENARRIAYGTITSGAVTAFTDARSFLHWSRLIQGAGMALSPANGIYTVAVDPNQVFLKAYNSTFTHDVDASMATMTRPERTVSSDPSGACSTDGEKVYSTASGNTFRCHTTWAAMGGGGGSASANGVYLQISGTNYIMPGMYPATLPSTTGFAWGNCTVGTECTATTTSTGGALLLVGGTGTSGWHQYRKSLSANTTITAAFGCLTAGTGSASGCGFGFRESSSGKLYFLRLDNSQASANGTLTTSYYTNDTTFSSNFGGPWNASTNINPQLIYAMIQNSAGSISVRLSQDGTNWKTFEVQSTGTVGTPDQYWLGTNGSSDSSVIVYSIKEE